MARVPYLSREDLPEDKRAIYDHMVSERGRVTRPMQALLNSPDLAGKVAETGFHVRFHSSALPPEVREIVPLATARELNSQYIWSRHAQLAQDSGVREEVVNAIRDGTPPRKLLPKEGVFVQFVQELLRDKKIRDATYAAVEHLLGRQGTVDLVVTIGHYALMAYVTAALEIELEPGFPPLLPQ